MDLEIFLAILMRWLHIGSAIILLGSALYWHLGLTGAGKVLQGDQLQRLYDEAASNFRPWVWGAAAAVVVAGLYNFLAKPAIPSGYHAWFGIKVLLALHVLAVSVLNTRVGVDPGKRSRWMSGVAVSGMALVAVSAYLRWLSR